MYKSLKKMKETKKKVFKSLYTRKKGNPSHHVAGSKFVLKTYLTEKSNVCKSLSSEELPYIIWYLPERVESSSIDGS